jgi:hypothetical protein
VNKKQDGYICAVKQIIMRPHDIVILLKIISIQERPWQYRDLSGELYIPISEISHSLRRSDRAGLVNMETRKVACLSFMEFLQYGFRYVFPVSPGALVTGTPTAHSHPFYKQFFKSELEFAWPDEDGTIRGLSIEPLHPNVPKAVKKDETLYKLLASIDILRVGKVREMNLAIEELKKAIL